MNVLKPQTHRGEALQAAMAEVWADTQDPVLLTDLFAPEIDEHTIFMAEHGVSHRKKNPLQVGATIVGLTVAGPILLEGYNFTPFKGAHKDCAEIRSIRQGDLIAAHRIANGHSIGSAASEAAWQAIQITVAASSGSDTNAEINTLDAPTLHPCGTPCRPQLTRHPAVGLDTPIRTLAVDLHDHTVFATENHTLAIMNAMYEGVTMPPVTRELLAQPAGP